MKALKAMAVVAALVSSSATAGKRDLARETLAPGDGWAAFSTGTTGGAAADADHVYVVHDRPELVAALANRSSTPKIIQVEGTIDANIADDGQPLTCDDYARNGYSLDAYLAAYDPAVWGRVPPSGPLEAARVASQQAQQERVRIRIGSNTTLVGIGKGALIRGAWFDVRDADNLIIRNITFRDTYDCFPQWSPTDGSQGNWNALYDAVSLRNATHVWVDHDDFADVETADDGQPTYFGRLFQVHDGHLDITNASDLVTASWNRFTRHDKVMLIGSSDSGSTAAGDRGKLRVTLHHNLFEDVGQRTPRVRFGKVHVYNNLYEIKRVASYVYSWGVGVESQIYAENNLFQTDRRVSADALIERFNGTAIHEEGTNVGGPSDTDLVDVLATYNEVNDPGLSGDVGWTPTLFTAIDPTRRVLPAVRSGAGPMEW